MNAFYSDSQFFGRVSDKQVYFDGDNSLEFNYLDANEARCKPDYLNIDVLERTSGKATEIFIKSSDYLELFLPQTMRKSESERLKALLSWRVQHAPIKDRAKWLKAANLSTESIVKVYSKWFPNNTCGIPEKLKELQITDQEALYQLALNDPLNYHISLLPDYGLDEEHRTKLLVAKFEGLEEHYKNMEQFDALRSYYKIERPDLVLKVLAKMVEKAPIAARKLLKTIPPSDATKKIEEILFQTYFDEVGNIGNIPFSAKVFAQLDALEEAAGEIDASLENCMAQLKPLFEKLLDPASRKPPEMRELSIEVLIKLNKQLIKLEYLKKINAEQLKDIKEEDLRSTLANLFERSFVHPRSEIQFGVLDWHICDIMRDPKLLSSWLKTLPKSRAVHCLVPSLCLFMGDRDSKELNGLNELITTKHRKLFRDGIKEKALSGFLMDITACTKVYTEKDKAFAFSMVKAILSDKNPIERSRALSDLLALEPDLIRDPTLPMDELKQLQKQAFLQVFQLPKDISLEEIERFLSSWRDPNAILTYLGKIRELPENQQKPLMEKYQQWFVEGVKGNFPRWRYETSGHLKQLRDFGFDQTVDHWSQKREAKLIEVINPAQDRPMGQMLRESLTKTLIDFKHVSSEKLPYLFAVLNQEKSLEEAEEAMSNIQNQIPTDTAFRAQQLALKAMGKEGSKQDLQELTDAVNELAKEDDTFSQFSQDIREFKRQFNILQKQPKSRDLLLFDTDDIQDLFLLASETGGCQTVYGTPFLNRSALSYVVDGKNRAVVLKDPKTNQSVARAIVRLLWDGEKPVLFVETHYLSYPNPELGKQIDSYATALGKDLGLEVYQRGFSENGKLLHVLGLSAPFEYSDAGGGMKDQPYSIPHVILLQ